ncbi:hypothetical protein KH5H1_06410 [Corallococcus caeni]|nr:hypothetical protein KH5H1_06410 [Corallococcus sp. KH5-1]
MLDEDEPVECAADDPEPPMASELPLDEPCMLPEDVDGCCEPCVALSWAKATPEPNSATDAKTPMSFFMESLPDDVSGTGCHLRGPPLGKS